MAVTRLSTVPFNTPGQNPRNVPGYVSSRLLGAAAAEAIAIPAGAHYVRIATTVDLFYSFSTTATVAGDTDDGSACELIKSAGPAEWLIIPAGATALSIISSGTPIVTASFYSN